MKSDTFHFRESLLQLLGIVLCLATIVASSAGQTPLDPAQASQPVQEADSSPEPTRATLDQGLSDGQRYTLSAAQIIAIARQNPEVMIELKTFVADTLQAKGVPAESEAITDEELFRQIIASSELRAGVTNLLSARGYISDADLDSAMKSNAASEHAQSDLGLIDANPRSIPVDGVGAAAGFTSPQLTDDYLAATRQRFDQELPSRRDPSQSRTTEQASPNITDDPKVLHRTAPYNLLSLRDLYTQVPDSPVLLKRFGLEVFASHGLSADPARSNAASNSMPLDVPLGPDYVLGPGDELSISLWGGVSQTFTRTISREGLIALPEAGQIQVAGLALGNAQTVIGDALRPQFRNAHVAVTLARLRTVRVYVVGDVQRPGAYDISSLASPLSALNAAGGPTAVGSLRVMRQLRNGKQIGEIDLYDFLLKGIRKGDDRLEGGDTLLVPPTGVQVAVYGAVKRPAIYELRGEKGLIEALDDAGGLTVAAELGHITIERIKANQGREIINVDSPAASGAIGDTPRVAEMELKDGDRIRVGAMLPYTEQVVYLQGHVARPGKLAFREGLRLADLLRSYRDLLPEPAARGDIVRLVAPDLHPETIEFNVADVLAGKTNPDLRPFDTVRVRGRYEQDSPQVTIQGEVLRPGSYPMFGGMSAAQLVRAAGGFKRDASLEDADLITYGVVGGSKITVERRTLQIGAAVIDSNSEEDSLLKPGDVLTIHQLTGWNDIGASILIQGEVAHPGSYGFKEGEHLSDVLQRAGGFRASAYPEGAVLTRPEVAALEEKSREELIRQVETTSAAARLSQRFAGSDQASAQQLIQQQQDQVIARLRSQPPTGRLVIHIDAPIQTWARTTADIEVRSGDVLIVPKRPGFVLISGQVYNASAITFVPGKTAGWYLQRAGGATEAANRKEIFVIRANGSVVGRRSGEFYDHSVLSTRLEAGDVIVVPQKIVGASAIWRNILGTAQVAASLAIAAAVSGL